MKAIVVGLGAIGTLVAVSLAEQGWRVAGIVRPHHLDTLRNRPLRVEGREGTRSARLARVDTSLDAMLAAFPADVVVVTVKSYDTDTVALDLERTSIRPYVLSLQNGVGNEERLAQAVSPDRVLAGVLSTPVEVLAVGHVRVARPSYKVGLAPMTQQEASRRMVQALGQSFAGAGFCVQYVDDYRSLKWTKLLLNITANAQSALLGWPPAKVFAHPIAGTLEVRAWREALAVMRKLGVKVISFGGYPLPWLTPLIERLPPAWVRPLMGKFAASGRGSKMPSVFLDLERGRQRTEIPWLNGAVARYGAEVGVPTPVNTVLNALVADVAAGRLPWSATRDHPEFILERVREAVSNE